MQDLKDIIDDAYQQEIRGLFNVLYYALASGTHPEGAEARFAKGLQVAQQAKDIALAVVSNKDINYVASLLSAHKVG